MQGLRLIASMWWLENYIPMRAMRCGFATRSPTKVTNRTSELIISQTRLGINHSRLPDVRLSRDNDKAGVKGFQRITVAIRPGDSGIGNTTGVENINNARKGPIAVRKSV